MIETFQGADHSTGWEIKRVKPQSSVLSNDYKIKGGTEHDALAYLLNMYNEEGWSLVPPIQVKGLTGDVYCGLPSDADYVRHGYTINLLLEKKQPHACSCKKPSKSEDNHKDSFATLE